MNETFQIGDLVTLSLRRDKILFRIVCFSDRPGSRCGKCEKYSSDFIGSLTSDDAHLEVVWKLDSSVAPSWQLGETVVRGVNSLRQPSPMLVLALESSQ